MVVAADLRPRRCDVIEKVRADLAEKGVALTEAELRAELRRVAAEARRQITQS